MQPRELILKHYQTHIARAESYSHHWIPWKTSKRNYEQIADRTLRGKWIHVSRWVPALFLRSYPWDLFDKLSGQVVDFSFLSSLLKSSIGGAASIFFRWVVATLQWRYMTSFLFALLPRISVYSFGSMPKMSKAKILWANPMKRWLLLQLRSGSSRNGFFLCTFLFLVQIGFRYVFLESVTVSFLTAEQGPYIYTLYKGNRKWSHVCLMINDH